MRKYLLLATASLSLASCTTHLTTNPESPGFPTAVEAGIPYRLPLAQIDLTLSWTISGCEIWTVAAGRGNNRSASGVDAEGSVLPSLALADLNRKAEYQVSFATAAAQKTEIVEGESFLIDYSRLTNPLKKGDVSVTYHEGTTLLKTVNSQIQGMEAEAITSAIKLGTNVAKIAFGLPPGLTGGAQTTGILPAETRSACLPETLEAIEGLRIATASFKKLTTDADRVATQIAALKARALAGELSESDKKKYDELIQESDRLAEKLLALKTVSDSLRNRLTFTQVWRFPDKVQLQEDQLLPERSKLEKWLEKLLTQDAVDHIFGDAQEYADFAANLTVTASLKPLLQEYNCVPASGPQPGCATAVPAGGIVFRIPVQARLRATRGNEELLAETIRVPQFGRLRVLQLRGRPFEHNSLSAEFAKDGLPVKAEYKVLEASGVKALGSAQEATAALLGIIADRKAQDDAEEAEAVADEKAAIESAKRQIELLEAQTKIATLQAATPASIEELEAKLALLRLQKEESELEAAIRANKDK